MNPKISIVIPTFNRAPQLPRTINSVISQTFSDWELLVVDDGSTDNTAIVLKRHMEEDNRIIYLIRPDNRLKGANACRNIGIEHAMGNYIAFLDSDDEWMSSKLENDWEFLKGKPNVRGIFSGIIVDNGERRKKSYTRAPYANESYVDFIFSKAMAQTCTYFVERDAAQEIKFDEMLQRHQDSDFFIRFGKAYGWEFLNTYNTIVNWEEGKIRSLHFPSMINFYEKYSREITFSENQANYLIWAWFQAKKSKQAYTDYYLKQLKLSFFKLSLKNKIFCMAPNLFYFSWRTALKLRDNLKQTF
jgi:glycosyltransferase involved in cell wall biosynthesis